MKNSALFNNGVPDGFTEVCGKNELVEREGKRFIVNDTEIAVFKLDGKIYALSNICPHQHTALIYDGFIEHGCVVCPAHGWMFDLQTGKTPTGGKGIDSYETWEVDERVFVRVIKKEFKW